MYAKNTNHSDKCVTQLFFFAQGEIKICLSDIILGTFYFPCGNVSSDCQETQGLKRFISDKIREADNKGIVNLICFFTVILSRAFQYGLTPGTANVSPMCCHRNTRKRAMKY